MTLPLWLQHALVLTLAAACLAYVGWQTIRTLRGRGGKVGSCCDKGCSEAPTRPAPTKSSGESSSDRIVFFPADLLVQKKRR